MNREQRRKIMKKTGMLGEFNKAKKRIKAAKRIGKTPEDLRGEIN